MVDGRSSVSCRYDGDVLSEWTLPMSTLPDANRELKTCHIEEYSNEEKPADGEIYRKIRQDHFQQNLSFEMRWWAHLTPHGRKNPKGLLRRQELTAAFDALLDIPGLWDGMMISTLHKVVAMKCDEVSKSLAGDSVGLLLG